VYAGHTGKIAGEPWSANESLRTLGSFEPEMLSTTEVALMESYNGHGFGFTSIAAMLSARAFAAAVAWPDGTKVLVTGGASSNGPYSAELYDHSTQSWTPSEIAQFQLRQVDLAEQRIGKDLVELREEAILVGDGEIAEIEVVGLRQPATGIAL
jgi:hypothetical protein